LPETPPSGRIGYSFVVNSSIRLSPGRARVLEVFLLLQTRYCPLQMGRVSLTPGWLALALVFSGCGTPEAPGAPGTRPRPARGDVKAAGKLPGLDATSQSKSQAKVVSTIEGDRMTVVSAPVTLSKQTESSPFRFAEVSRESGIDFVHFSGMTEDKYFPTANGSGVAIFDADNDGLMDVYFASATLLPLGTAVKGPNRLYRNLGNGKFRDVTDVSGLGYRGFCQGTSLATSTTTAIRTCSCATMDPTCFT